jgi:hypothetical protein
MNSLNDGGDPISDDPTDIAWMFGSTVITAMTVMFVMLMLALVAILCLRIFAPRLNTTQEPLPIPTSV